MTTGIGFIMVIFNPWGVPVGALLIGANLLGWYWPSAPHAEDLADEQPRRTQHGVPQKSGPEHGGPPLPSIAPRLDVGELPLSAFGARDPLWWGVLSMMAIEGTVFALTFVSYFYLRDHPKPWPPTPPDRTSLQLAAAGLGLLLLSCWPMHRASAAAQRGSLSGIRKNLGWTTALGLAFLVARAFEFSALPFRWDAHAHGSVVWAMLVMHTLHGGVFGSGENLTFLVLLWRGPVEEKHLVDVSVTGMYWYFVVILDALCVGIADVFPLLWPR